MNRITVPVRRVIQALAEVANRWRSAGSPYPQRAATAPTPFPYRMVAPMLDRLLQDWTEERLSVLLEEVFGSLKVLDGYHEGRRVLGYPRVVHILPATPLVGWSSLATALLVKSASLAKLSSQELVWTPLFIEILREVDPEIGSWVEWVHWDRRETERTRALVESADAVVVYGSDEAVASIRGMVRGETPLFAYGNRFALGLILQEADYGEAAQRLAQDCVRLYQTGCLSPQWVLVEGDRKAALRFAEELASAVEEQMRPFPIRLDFGTAVVVRREREAALFEEETHLWGASDLAWTIILRANPRLETLGTFNTTQVTPFRLSGDGDQGKGLLSLSIPWSRVQAVAFAGDLNRILSLLEPLCLPRLCQVGELQTPPFDWYENGRRLLHDLARWSRIE